MKSEKFSFEKENIKKRKKDQSNVYKWYGVSLQEKPFQVGTEDVIDPYSGSPIYIPASDGDVAEESVFDLDEHLQGGWSDDSANEGSSDDGVFDSSSMSDEELALANEIYQRLMNEAAADENARQAEIEALKREQEATSADYNAETGSYSGLYGKKPMNDAEAEALANILNNNSAYSKSIEDIIKENQ